MSYDFYKVLHFFGLFMLFSGFGAQLLNALQGGSREWIGKRAVAVLHGVGLVLVLFSGFGLTAKMSLSPLPGWVWGKLAIWVALGAVFAVIKRRPRWAALLWALILALGTVAAWLARTKPA